MAAPPAIFRWRQRSVVFLLLAVALMLAIGSTTVRSAPSPMDQMAVRANILDLLANETKLPLPVRQRHQSLTWYYGENGGDLLWIGNGRATDMIARLRSAHDDGLDPSAYPADQLAKLSAVVEDTDEHGKAIIELHFSAAFLEYASDLQIGRFLPRKTDPNFFLQEKTIDQSAALARLAGTAGVNDFFVGWQPKAPEYAALREALAEYRAIARAGGWPSVPLGETLKPGMNDPRVPALRARLAVTDRALAQVPPELEMIYGDDLVAVVMAFQARHGLDIDGLVGRATIVALNVPVEVRVRELIVAMERWRWMPDDLGSHYVIVNIAGFELKRVQQGKIEEEMAVVVGKPYHRTPVFSDAIRYLEINPYWNVPISIALKEELPKLRRNPAARSSAGFEAVQGGRVYPLTAIDWSRYGSNNFPFQLRQRPGPKNALGRVKFMFPNKFNVYLHDTPARSLFVRSTRAFSHGCIRLSRPIDLADQVLDGVPGWNRRRIDSTVASGNRTVVKLVEPLPVHITYLTAWVDSGVANFRTDIYQHDKKLLAALDGRSLAW